MRSTRPAILISALTTAAAVALTAPAAGATGRLSTPDSPAHPGAVPARVIYPDLRLPDGRHALVYSDGLAEVSGAQGSRVEVTWVPLFNPAGNTSLADRSGASLPDKGQLVADLLRSRSAPFAAQEVVAVYRGAAPKPRLNTLLDRLGVDRVSPLFTGMTSRRLEAMYISGERATGNPMPDFSRAVVLHLTAESVPGAVAALRADPDVAFAEPDWIVSTDDTPPQPVGAPEGPAPATTRQVTASASISTGPPQNYALTSSAQALLNRPGVDDVPAYMDIVKRYHQLPGHG